MFRPAITVTTLTLVLTGCAGQDHKPPASPPNALNYLAPDIYAESSPPAHNINDTIRTGRYRLTRTTPTAVQKDLLAQIVEVSVPTHFNPTVGDAIRHSLARTGYSLCPVSSHNIQLFSRELPAAHYTIGPMRLRDALQILGGQAWRVDVDKVSRTVCYSLRSAPVVTSQLANQEVSR